MDSFKGSLTSYDAGHAVCRGLEDACKALKQDVPPVAVFPLADGGEGTVTALTQGLGGSYRNVKVRGPLQAQVEAIYGIIPAGEPHESTVAVIEIAAAAGLWLVPERLRNPLNTTTYGVGQIILNALKHGCRTFLIGIGGSATNDGGIGMLRALGYAFKDAMGRETDICGKDLDYIASVDAEDAHPLLKECTFRIACDVSNPLTGPNGAAAVYGPQKGATPDIIERLDRGLTNLDRVVSKAKAENIPLFPLLPAQPVIHPPCPNTEALRQSVSSADAPLDLTQVPGAGAAGGLGYAFLQFLNGSLEPGAQMIIDAIGLEEKIKEADLIITGEGRLDQQTFMGKAPATLARMAKAYGKPVVIFCGSLEEEALQQAAPLFDYSVAVTPPDGLLKDATYHVRKAAAEFFTRNSVSLL